MIQAAETKCGWFSSLIGRCPSEPELRCGPHTRREGGRCVIPRDKHAKCLEWAMRNECSKNQNYMLPNCSLSRATLSGPFFEGKKN